MKQHIELEYKMILNKRQFTAIKNHNAFDYPFKQVNYYYDTKQLALGAKRYALRIREVNGEFVLTLKVPHKKGVMEHEQVVSSQYIRPEEISDSLRKTLNFIAIEDLVCFGELTTFRAIHETPFATICLDENYYHGVHDYEIEYEVKKQHDSYPAFLAFLGANGIRKHRPAMGKARRVKQAVKLLD